jgi:hypothetical protein
VVGGPPTQKKPVARFANKRPADTLEVNGEEGRICGRPESEWQRKGATLSDKTARKEFGLTQDDIIWAIRAGKLHYREGSMYGNPWLRLLRREVESLVKGQRGDAYLKDQKVRAELTRINRELKRLKIPYGPETGTS